MKHSIQTVIFDLDGTLLNTLEDLADSCNEALRRFGCPERSIDEVRRFVGNGLGVLMEKAIPHGRQNPDYAAALAELRACYARNWRNKTRPYPEILPLMDGLHRAGIHTGIVSNKPDAQVKELAALYFAGAIPPQAAIGEKESEGIRRKPFPDSVFTVMRFFGATAENTIYAGDSDVDIATARNAGIPCVSVTWGFRSRQFLIDSGATLLADRPSDIEAFLAAGVELP